ncbi:conserved hypothetical protein [gamma proteobacterium NOR5-3]|nr:conserved hypothetical protein [gamma proteobacterium NOR5-3]
MKAAQTKVCVLIFSGYNVRAIVAFIRTLSSIQIEFGIVAVSSEDPIFRTDYSKNVTAVRECKSLDKSDLARCVKETQSVLASTALLVAPSTEYLNRFFLSQRDFFTGLGVLVPLVEKHLYELISDKKPFAEICRDMGQGVLLPQDIEWGAPYLYPFVAKPIRYAGSEGGAERPIIFESEQQFIGFSERCDPAEWYLQEYVYGRSFYLLYYFSRSGEVTKFSMENLIQQEGGGSILCSRGSDLHRSDCSVCYENLFKRLGFHGLVMVEVRGQHGEYYMIEANPRFWGPSQLFVDAGVNLFVALLNDWLELDCTVERSSPDLGAKYFWSGGFLGGQGGGDVALFEAPERSSEILSELGGYLGADVLMRPDTFSLAAEAWGANE